MTPPMLYIHSDVPEGMTLASWRAAKSNGERRFTWRVFWKGLIGGSFKA